MRVKGGAPLGAIEARRFTSYPYQKLYDLPIYSKNELPDYYEREGNDYDEKDEKVAQRTLHPRPLLPPGRR